MSENKIESKELAFPRSVKRGSRGKAVRRVQEWLCLNGHIIAVDSIFGPATEAAVKAFCETRNLSLDNNEVTQEIFDALSAPMRSALNVPAPRSQEFRDTVVVIAKEHLANHPREVGGQNMGPWVRLYMSDNEGEDWPWCAGFVTFVIRQASIALGQPMPFPRTFSCDLLAANAKDPKRDLFIAERNINSSNSSDKLPPGTLFLSRRVSGDWTHTGFVIEAKAETFETIEGNTNDEGHREGYEVCIRTRSYKKKDFVLLSRTDS